MAETHLPHACVTQQLIRPARLEPHYLAETRLPDTCVSNPAVGGRVLVNAHVPSVCRPARKTAVPFASSANLLKS